MRNTVLKFLSLMVVFAFGISAAAFAEDAKVEGVENTANIERYALEKPHTQIVFIGDHLGFSKSYGRFMAFDGEFVLNHDDLSKSSVNVEIDAASLEMGHEKWSAHLKNEDFLDVEKFPEIRFVSESVELIDESTAKVHGVLSMRGIDKPVTLDVHHNKSGVHPFSGKYIAGFSAEAEIKRSDFGMTYGLPLLADRVTIKISVEGIRHEADDAAEADKSAEE